MNKLIDRQDIGDLLSRYFLCWDERRFDAESFREIFTEDIQAKLPPTEIIIGLEEVSRRHEELSSLFVSTHHMTSNLLCSFADEDSAKCRANFSAYHLYTEAKQKEYGSELLIVRGVVEFSASRKGGMWRIHDLNVECVYRL